MSSERDNLIAEGLNALAGWISGFKYESVGGACPGCGHGPLYQRHVGPPSPFGHDQQSCPCRLARQANAAHPCGCEWTLDK
jgi:hypothetical protein